MERFCSFFGHRDYVNNLDLEKKVKSEIINCIENKKIYNFLIGGYGKYDAYCARYLKEIKKLYPQIKILLVYAYLNNNIGEDNKKYIKETYDETIYPNIENIPLKLAILYRNRYMIDKSDYIIFYVNRSWGGAYKAFEYAYKKRKLFVNIGIKKEL